MEATTGTGNEKELFESTGTTDPFFDVSYYPTATMKWKIERYVIGCLWVGAKRKNEKDGRWRCGGTMGLVHALIISIVVWYVSNDALIAIISGLLWLLFSTSGD